MKGRITCKSCGNEFSGNFCNVCGEKVIKQEDRTLKYLLSELFNAFTFVDSKLWHTMKVMLLSPGRFANDYVEGRRMRYMRPMALFFMANLLYFLFPLASTFTTYLEYQTDAFFYSDLAKSMVDGYVVANSISYEDYTLLYNMKTAALSKLLLVSLVLIISFFFALVHMGGKKKLMADHITCSLELISFVLLVILEILILFISLIVLITEWKFILSDIYITAMSVLILSWYFFRMEKNFYEFTGFRRVANTVLCIVALAISYSIYRGMLFFITFWSIS